jgi:glycosyltransferase involved in cell wall biosynthesis
MYGYIDSPYDFIRSKIDLIVIPSLWEETLGRVAYEASMAGFPVLVSRIGGLPESASLAGKNYLEFEPSNYFDLSRQISGFYSGNDNGIPPSFEHRELTSILIRKISELSGN